MGKEKSLDEIEAELARMEEELQSLQSSKPTPPPKKEKGGLLKRKREAEPEPAPATTEADAPAPEPSPPSETKPSRFSGLTGKLPFGKKKETPEPAPASEPAPPEEKLGFLSKMRRGKDAAPAAAVPEPAPEAAPPPPPEPAPVARPEPVAERIPPPVGTWVQEGKSWRRVAEAPPLVPLPGGLPPEEPGAPPPKDGGNRRRLLYILIPLAILLLAGAVVAAAVVLLGGGAGDDANGGPPAANVTTPAGDIRAAFALSPTRSTNAYKLNEAVTFNAGSTVVPAGETGSYAWDFGDGTKGTGKTTTHAYRTAGNYTATLSVTAAGATASTSKTLRVVAPPTAALAVTKGGSALGATYHGEAIDFDSAGSSGFGTLSFAWTFGDGTSATGAKASHTYTGPGRYSVTLTVTDGNGVPATRSKSIHIGMRQPIEGSAPSSADGLKVVPFNFNAAPGGLVPKAIRANITYAPTVTGGAGGIGLPVPVDELNIVLKDAAGTVVAQGAGSNGRASLEFTTVDPATLTGPWTLEVQRPQGGATSAKTFTGMLEVELPPAP